MKIYKKITYTINKKHCIKIICDWCGEEIKSGKLYEVNEFEIKWKTGDSYPEGGSGKLFSFDLCFDCRKKLFEQSRKMGIKVQEEEWDF